LLDRLARYLAFRGRQFPATAAGRRPMTDLLEMAKINGAEALGAKRALPSSPSMEYLSR
jgi:cytosine/adenosine deaminase-related metal-dependent hydrolase